ncbi:ABC transporter substrate-binding protein [Muribacter muris]|uniref:ABC transporter substrate-binding protein n=1 Tax=Muribacter muris TaxID=67855 RepID=A0A4Y9JXB3_9PAST|nr:ABC transporter substrate-binding protein [Muribacter muris]MBF0785187.1 ABC transporter substrate-binding protein [Muribacter muris]MBF0827399.1 ABC transporter substrate-binding protein [Muribacter muris]TFV10138.1 ABC transporter substrate-binding protein [Muribacter muris]
MKAFFTALAIIVAIALGVYFSSPNTAQSASPHNRVNVIAPWEINSIDPAQAGAIFQRMNLAETLVEADASGQLVPNLARSWSSNDEASLWRFQLREGVVFHNGEPLTAQAVANSLNIAKTKPGVLQQALVEQIQVAAPDEIEIQLRKPLVAFPAYLTHYSTLILAEQAYNAQGDVQQLIGTGAFQAKKIEIPQKLTAERFERYWGELPQLAQANYIASSRSETRMLMAQSDPASLVFNLDPASVDRLKNDPALSLNSVSIARTIQLKMDIGKPFFQDPIIRKALSKAIDRRAIAQQVLKIKNGAADQLLPPLFSEWRIERPAIDYSTAQIKAALMSAGYHYTDAGILTDQKGQPFQFTLRTFADRPELPLIATILQDQWRKIGVEVKVSVGNFSEIPAGHQDGSLEMALYAFNYGKTLDPVSALTQVFAEQGSDWGVMNWQNSHLTQTFRQLEKERDPVRANTLKQKASQIIAEELPIIPVVYYQQNVVAHKAMGNVILDPFERRFFLEKLKPE